MTTKVLYRNSAEAFHGYKGFITEIIEKSNAKKLCDIGGGANPLLESEYILNKGIDYSVLDISATELEKAPKNYTKILADIAAPDFSQNLSKFDLIFSKYLAEHIKDGEQFHKNILKMLKDGGLAVHFFPTLYSLPFLVNYLAPEALADKILNLVHPRGDRYQHEKFPAYYNWCRGPTRNQIKKFEGLGYEVVEYRGFFGHGGYYNRVKFIKNLHERKTDYLFKKTQSFVYEFCLRRSQKAS